jgi:parallel beta-helix repeat protein
MKVKILVLCVVLLCIFSFNSWATDYYCDYIAGSNSNPGTSISVPWKTPPGTVGDSGSGWAKIKPGDTVYLKGGVQFPIGLRIDNSFYDSGLQNNYVSIKSGHLASPVWGTGRAIIDGGKKTLRGVYIVGIKYMKIHGLQVQNQYGVGTSGNGPSAIETESSADFVWIVDNVCQNVTCGDANGGYGIEVNNSHYALIEQNICQGNAEKGIEIYHGNNATIRQNVVRENGEHGIVISGSDANVYRNIIYHNSVTEEGSGANIKADEGARMVLHNNVIYNGNGWNIQVMGNSPGCKIYNNTCYNGYMTQGGDYYGTNIQIYGSQSAGCEIVNNIFYYYGHGENGLYYQLVFRPPLPTTPNFIVKNNIFYGNQSGQNVILYGDKAVGSNSYTIQRFESTFQWAKSNLQVEPGFEGGVNASVGYLPENFKSDGSVDKTGLQVTATSPAIGAGLPIEGVNIDINGFNRPQNSPWTVGAFDVGSVSMKPVAPANLKVFGTTP